MDPTEILMHETNKNKNNINALVRTPTYVPLFRETSKITAILGVKIGLTHGN